MKKLMKRKNQMLSLTMAIMLLASGCTKKEVDVASAEEVVYKIGITQIVDHKALNSVREGYVRRLKELGMNVSLDIQNANGDISTAQLIAEKLVEQQSDLIFAIATPSAQSVQQAAKNISIPVVFSAVTDPKSAGLVNADGSSSQITGVTDAATSESIQELIEISRSLRNDKNTLGVIYNTGEANSTYQVKELQRITQKMNIELVEVGIAAITDIDQGLEIISEKADSLCLINDNMLASSIGLICEKAKTKGLITISTTDSFVDEGALLSLGINYEQLGIQGAEMTKRILVDKESVDNIPVENSTKLFKKINQKTGEALQIDIEKLKDKDTELV